MSTILIVDDEKDIQLLYRKELEINGYKAVAVGTIDEAKELFGKGGIDLVVLDIKLTAQDSGLDVLKWMRALDRTIPIIINSAYPSYKIEFSTWLANEYLVKSGDLQELISTIARLLKQRTGQPNDDKD